MLSSSRSKSNNEAMIFNRHAIVSECKQVYWYEILNITLENVNQNLHDCMLGIHLDRRMNRSWRWTDDLEGISHHHDC